MNKYYLSVLAFVLAVLVVAVVGVKLLSKKYYPVSTIVPTAIPTAKLVRGTLSLQLKSSVVDQSKEFEVELYGDSKGVYITGYDAVISYDPSILEYVTTQSQQSLFTVYTKSLGGKLAITGIKSPQYTQPTSFQNAPLATIRFLPKKIGECGLELLFTQHSNKQSTLITSSSENILDETRSVSVKVGKQVTAVLNKPLTLENGAIFTVTSIELPASNCRDCMNVVNFTVKRNAQTSSGSFKEGGFAGLVQNTSEVLGTTFTLVSTQSNQIVFIYSP